MDFYGSTDRRGLPLPQIPDEDIAPIVAYMKKAL
jgi:hypothetical protein